LRNPKQERDRGGENVRGEKRIKSETGIYLSGRKRETFRSGGEGRSLTQSGDDEKLPKEVLLASRRVAGNSSRRFH